MAKEKVRYVQLAPSDFLSDADFQTWDAETRGVYTTIIFYMYANGGCVENNEEVLQRMTNCRKETWKVTLQKISKKFKVRGTKLYHNRVSFELKKAAKYIQDKKRAGLIGAEKRWQCHDSANGGANGIAIANISKEKEREVKNVKKKNTEGAAAPPPDPRIKIFIDQFAIIYESVINRKYIVSSGKDGRLVKSLLATLDNSVPDPLPELERATRNMLADDWGKSHASIGLLSSQFNKWRGDSNTSVIEAKARF